MLPVPLFSLHMEFVFEPFWQDALSREEVDVSRMPELLVHFHPHPHPNIHSALTHTHTLTLGHFLNTQQLPERDNAQHKAYLLLPLFYYNLPLSTAESQKAARVSWSRKDEEPGMAWGARSSAEAGQKEFFSAPSVRRLHTYLLIRLGSIHSILFNHVTLCELSSIIIHTTILLDICRGVTLHLASLPPVPVLGNVDAHVERLVHRLKLHRVRRHQAFGAWGAGV